MDDIRWGQSWEDESSILTFDFKTYPDLPASVDRMLCKRRRFAISLNSWRVSASTGGILTQYNKHKYLERETKKIVLIKLNYKPLNL